MIIEQGPGPSSYHKPEQSIVVLTRNLGSRREEEVCATDRILDVVGKTLGEAGQALRALVILRTSNRWVPSRQGGSARPKRFTRR